MSPPTDPPTPQALAQEGERRRVAGEYERALAAFSQALALAPRYPWALAHRGECHHALGQHEAALADFSDALALRPAYEWALAHRGALYTFLRRYDAALSDLNRALALQPTYAWAYAYRARLFEFMRLYQAGLADFKQAAALDPGVIHGSLATESGLLHSFVHRYAEAEAAYEQALREDPTETAARYGLVVVCWMAHGAAATRPALEALQAELQAPSPHVAEESQRCYALGGLAALTEQRDAAFTYLQMTLDIHPYRMESARHDLAWRALREDPRFRALDERYRYV